MMTGKDLSVPGLILSTKYPHTEFTCFKGHNDIYKNN